MKMNLGQTTTSWKGSKVITAY